MQNTLTGIHKIFVTAIKSHLLDLIIGDNMSKFTHKADLNKIFYISTMVEFMRAIQVSAQKGYTYYFYSQFEISKLESVLGRLDDEYHISDGRMDRSRRYNEHNRAITIGHFFYPGTDTIYFILMSKPSPTGNKYNNFFEKLPYKDLNQKSQRLKINHYTLSRTNQEKSKKHNGEWTVVNVNEIWDFGLSEEYKSQKIQELQKYLKDGNWSRIGYLYREISQVLGFALVRIDYEKLRKQLLKITNRYIKSSGIPPHEIWNKINFNPPLKIGYFLHNKIDRFAMKEISSNSILKKIHKNT